MNAVEFAEQYRRMCRSYDQCCNEKECCPLTGDCCDIGNENADINKIVKVVIGHAIKSLPAADVAPVRHGRWMNHYRNGAKVYQGWVASCCDKWNDGQRYYCPHCGAKMEGGADHETD